MKLIYHKRGEKKSSAPGPYSGFVLLFLLVTLFITVYTYILQKSYSYNTLEAAVERDIQCSDSIHRLVSNKFTKEDFSEINELSDMDSERYLNTLIPILLRYLP